MLRVAYAEGIVMDGASVRSEKYVTRLLAVCISKKQKDATLQKIVGLFLAVSLTAVLIFGSVYNGFAMCSCCYFCYHTFA
jgi:hypothetical protein